jgi:hypothetical protein
MSRAGCALICAGPMAGAGIPVIIAASCTENGSGDGDTGRVSPEGTDMPSISVTNCVCIAAGKVAKSASQDWTHRDLKAS